MTRIGKSASIALVTILLGGCQLFVNPWRDDHAHAVGVTTNSAEYAKSLDVEPVMRQRDHQASTVLLANGTVTHGALYFEDPCETSGSDDERFAWTIEDHANFFFGPFRYLLNGAFVPVSVVDTPPWRLMGSDGKPSRKVLWMPHDADRWISDATN